MWNLLVPVLAGTLIGGYFNQQAANTAANATLQGAQIQANTENQIAQNAQTQAAPAQSFLKNVMATSDELTPAQKQQLADNRVALQNEIRGSNFAGSGRTAADLFKRADSDFVNNALTTNRNQGIAAADTLAGRATAADNAALAAARTSGGAVSTVGQVSANSDLATGKLFGQAIGDISSAINRQSKLQSVG